MYLDKTGVFLNRIISITTRCLPHSNKSPLPLHTGGRHHQNLLSWLIFYCLERFFTDSSKSAAPFLSCCVPTSNSAPNLLWCSLCVRCSLSLTTKRTHSRQVISKKAVTAESRAAQQKCWAGDCPVKTSGGNTHKCKPDCSFKGGMGGRMEERKRNTIERQARDLSLNRQIVFLQDKLIMFHLCISYI